MSPTCKTGREGGKAAVISSNNKNLESLLRSCLLYLEPNTGKVSKRTEVERQLIASNERQVQ
jgi:hypothetical protein